MALVAVAGPLSNVVLAVLATASLALLMRVPAIFDLFPSNIVETLQLFGMVSIQVNLALALFNLLPIPPLDGFNVVQAFLPRAVLLRLSRFGRAPALILMLLLFTGGFQILRIPLIACYRFLIGFVG